VKKSRSNRKPFKRFPFQTLQPITGLKPGANSMPQLFALISLKWTLFRNSLRSRKAVANRIATILGMLAALTLALLIAIGLGFAAYAVTSPGFALEAMAGKNARGTAQIPSAEFIFFSILSMLYLLWATLPLTMGASRQFDPGNLLLYPIGLRKLFTIDLLSEFASLQSVFAIPAILAMAIGAGLARNNLGRALLIALAAILLGVVLSRGISTVVGTLMRKKRTRGENLIAVFGALAGLGGIWFAQVAPIVLRHQQSVTALRWTPPGAVAFSLTNGLGPSPAVFIISFVLLSSYVAVLLAFTYFLAKRAVLGIGGSKSRGKEAPSRAEISAGWQLPFVSPGLSAVIEKEFHYAMRNAQLRMMALMPLLLIGVRLMNRRRFGTGDFDSDAPTVITGFLKYGEGLMATGGILYVFLILSGLSCNLFAFEHAGMRTLVLAPINRKTILLGKNIVYVFVALVLSIALLIIDQLVFGYISPLSILFAVLSFTVYAALMSLIGNWFSIRFPKRMKMGRRMNVSGVVGILLIPMMILLSLPPLAAVAAGYVAQSLLVEYATLAVLAMLSIVFYAMSIPSQGESLEKRELEILEAVNDPGGN
jgi:predicted permease